MCDLLLVVEEWEFTDAENVNFTLGCKCNGCMWRQMHGRKYSRLCLGKAGLTT